MSHRDGWWCEGERGVVLNKLVCAHCYTASSKSHLVNLIMNCGRFRYVSSARKNDNTLKIKHKQQHVTMIKSKKKTYYFMKIN